MQHYFKIYPPKMLLVQYAIAIKIKQKKQTNKPDLISCETLVKQAFFVVIGE